MKKEKNKKPFLQRIKEWVESILIALAIALVIRAFLIQPYRIPSGSMIPALQVGDQLFVAKYSYAITIPFTDKQLYRWARPKRGDIVVFRNPEDPDRGVCIRMISPVIWVGTLGRIDLNPHKDFIKRIIGVPGDEIMIKNRQVFINKKPIDESYKIHVNPQIYGISEMDNWPEPKVIPKGKYFVMGDNRDFSYDSRMWGYVPENLIVGKAMFIHWPPWRIRWLK
ncbi:TPA: signal peptidase I [bacterium]|nr:signal peptidase I [bacterium]